MRISSKYWQAASLPVILLLTACAYWPGIRSFFYLDDFFLLAISRLLNEPASLFTHNHFPGSIYFRPVGMTFWWAATKLFGNTPEFHYCTNLAIHLLTAACLWQFVLEATRSRPVAIGTLFAFALHPITIGTSLWLANRFDLLASLFAVLAIHMAWRWRDSPTNGTLVKVFVCAALASFSKEIGFVCFVPIFVLWAWPQNGMTMFSRTRFGAVTALVALGLVLFLWRAIILGSALDAHFVEDEPLAQLALDGITRWAAHFSGFILVLSRMSPVQRAFEIVGVFVVGLFACVGIWHAWKCRSAEGLAPLIWAGLLLSLCTAVVQAPLFRRMTFAMDVPLTSQFAVEARLFYLSSIGLLIALACLCHLGLRFLRTAEITRKSLVVALTFCVVPWIHESHHLATQYRKESFVQMRLLLAAQATIERLQLTKQPCSVFALGLPPDQEFIFAMQFDAAMKALAVDVAAVENCRFTTERAPWFFVMRGDSGSQRSLLPMRSAYLNGKVVPPLVYGGVEIDYLNLLEDTKATSLGDAHFIKYENDRFVDVTEQVLAGKVPVNFRCTRGKEQCYGSNP